jgi:hypothetical protein
MGGQLRGVNIGNIQQTNALPFYIAGFVKPSIPVKPTRSFSTTLTISKP